MIIWLNLMGPVVAVAGAIAVWPWTQSVPRPWEPPAAHDLSLGIGKTYVCQQKAKGSGGGVTTVILAHGRCEEKSAHELQASFAKLMNKNWAPAEPPKSVATRLYGESWLAKTARLTVSAAISAVGILAGLLVLWVFNKIWVRFAGRASDPVWRR